MRSQTGPAAGRLQIMRLLIIAVIMILIGRLWQLQMVRGEKYRLLADQNRFRQVDVGAPRGVIYDRDGQILARNQPSFNVVIIPASLPRDAEGVPDEAAEAMVVDRLFTLLAEPVPTPTPTPLPDVGSAREEPGVPDAGTTLEIRDRDPFVRPRAEVEQAIIDGRLGGAYKPIVVATHIEEATAFLIAEDAVNLPGVELALEPIRDYATGALTAHIIGHMGHISENALPGYEARGYNQNDLVGLTGLEASFEKKLRGKNGRQTIEVDVNGRRVRTIGEPDPAEPGHNLILNLDTGLQRAATTALQAMLDKSKGFTKATQGAVVALDPHTGAVLALVSLPSYDTNLFTKGITPEAWDALTSDPDRPLFDRVIGGQYPPGSIFKTIVASAALEENVIDTRTKLGDGFDSRNDGIIWLPNRYFPWDRSKDQPFYSWIHKYGRGHGLVTIRDALAVSDDIYFYQMGGGYLEFQGLGVDLVGYYTEEFGVGQPTGIELPGEAYGLVPNPKWKRINYAENWVTGDTYNISIGQGFVLATPLQMANATAAVANRGYLYQPQLVDKVTDPEGKVVQDFEPVLIREVPVNPRHLDTVREGMFGAVNWPYGTATDVTVDGITVGGKTGTAEFFRDDNHDYKPDRDASGNLPTHAWFTAFAPYIDPEIVVTVFVANGGEGSSTAAPVAAEIFRAYFQVGEFAPAVATGSSDAPNP